MSPVADVFLSISRTPAVALLVKVTVLFAVGLTAVALVPRARASVRHLLLASTFAAVLALPVVAMFAPALEVPVGVNVGAASTGVTSVSPASGRLAAAAPAMPLTTPAAAWPPFGQLLLAAWVLGAVASLAPLLPMTLCTRRLCRTSLPWRGALPAAVSQCGDGAAIQLLRHEDVASPITFGWRRPAIVLPVDAPAWRDEDLDRALVHELEHVRRRDWLVQLSARVTCAVYWFHPLAWAAWRRLGLEAERACDDAVVGRADAADYAAQLVSLAEHRAAVPAAAAVGMARRSDLALRVTALLDATQPRGRVGLPIRLAAGAGVLMLVGVVSPLQAVTVTAAPRAVSAATGGQHAPRSASLHRLDTGLYEAAGEGDLPGIDELLGQGANVDAELLGDGSPLIAAARNGHLAAVRALLDRGANPNLAVPGDGNALIAAAGRDYTDVVALLLDRGAAIEQIVPGDENALITASGSGALAAVRLLVARGADVNARVLATSLRGNEWRTPLSQARRGRHADIVAVLEQAGARE